MSPLRTVGAGVGPLGSIVHVIIQDNYRTRELYYSCREMETPKKKGFRYKGQISTPFYSLFRVNSLYGVLRTGDKEFCQFQ